MESKKERKKIVVEIILVKYNNTQFEDPCIMSVIANTKEPYHLRAYNNYPINYNIGKLWNRLIKESDAEYICLLNTDTLVEPDWLKKLVEVFSLHKNVGVVGPTTTAAKTQQAKEPKATEVKIVDFGNDYPGWCLSGFCIVFPKKVWEEVGGFPEDFGFYGQEVVLIDKMMDKGYRQLWRKDVFVWHAGQATVKKAVASGELDEEKERAIAREKFGKLREERKKK